MSLNNGLVSDMVSDTINKTAPRKLGLLDFDTLKHKLNSTNSALDGYFESKQTSKKHSTWQIFLMTDFL